ncbi:MAG: MFS transporter [Chloroflexi bacterium]|nr:MFS transporter [Chloroflexota bacterium]
MTDLPHGALVIGPMAALSFLFQAHRLLVGALLGASTILVDFGVTATAAGLLAAVYFPAYGAVQIPSGILADRGRPARNLVWSALAMFVATLTFAFAPNLELAVVARIAVGVGSGLIFLSVLKVGARVAADSFPRFIGLMISLGSFGGIAALAGFPIMLSIWDWRTVTVLSALPLLPVVVALYWLDRRLGHDVEERQKEALPIRSALWVAAGSPAFWVVTIAAMGFNGSHFAMLSWVTRYARDGLGLSPWATGILPGLVPTGILVGAYISGWIFNRSPELGRRIYYGSIATYGVLNIVMLTLDGSMIGTILVGVLAFVLGFLFSNFFICMSLVARAVPPGALGTATGILNGLAFVPAFILPWAMGWVMDLVDRPTSSAWTYSQSAFAAAFALSVAQLAACLLIAWSLSHWSKRS